MTQPFRVENDTILLAVRVTPNASRNALEGVEIRENDRCVLRIRVCAAPDKGKANKAVIALLAKYLGTPKSAIKIMSGETARLKQLCISAGPDAIHHKLKNWIV